MASSKFSHVGFEDNLFYYGSYLIVTFVPIIYTVTENERSLLKAAEMKGRVILGDLEKIMEDHKIPMFGCAECMKPIPGCGIF